METATPDNVTLARRVILRMLETPLRSTAIAELSAHERKFSFCYGDLLGECLGMTTAVLTRAIPSSEDAFIGLHTNNYREEINQLAKEIATNNETLEQLQPDALFRRLQRIIIEKVAAEASQEMPDPTSHVNKLAHKSSTPHLNP